MAGKRTRKGKDTIDTSDESIYLDMEEFYRKHPGTRPTPEESEEIHRYFRENPVAVLLPNRQFKPVNPKNPEELVEALKERGVKVNVASRSQLEARRNADKELEFWSGGDKKKK
ncbi:MAG: hypothetical protein A4E73_01998 [Syntrophaceae bacterium PtaU1.Bin231]|nr:MAG: hypothetical protein A4E73_01998 [Syntrophaceae bacterium PtaU1.Bin231]